MTIIKRFLSICAFGCLVASSSAKAEEQPRGACDSPQSVLDRAWVAYTAKNPVAINAETSLGARLLALNVLLTHCVKPAPNAKPTVKLDPLDARELETLKAFAPSGPMSALAGCLERTTRPDVLQFVLASDVAAFSAYQKSKRLGAVDQAALIKMLESSKGCGDVIPSSINADELYADANWYVRIKPNLSRVVAWHANGGKN